MDNPRPLFVLRSLPVVNGSPGEFVYSVKDLAPCSVSSPQEKIPPELHPYCLNLKNHELFGLHLRRGTGSRLSQGTLDVLVILFGIGT